MAQRAVKEERVSIRVASETFGISQVCYCYRSKLGGDNALIADWLLGLTTTPCRWGFGLCFLCLGNVRGLRFNHKRVYRIYRELGRNLPIKRRRRLKRDRLDPLAVPRQANEAWSIDFMPDVLATRQGLRSPNILDDYNREGWGVEVDFGLPVPRITRALEQIFEWRGTPKVIRSDKGSEVCRAEYQHWYAKRGIQLPFIQPGEPTLNTFVERFDRTVMHEWLDEHLFESTEHAQQTVTEWRWRYNHQSLHMALLGGIPPNPMLAHAA